MFKSVRNLSLSFRFLFFISDVADYRLQDPDFEKQFGCNITKTLQKPDRHKLFEVRNFVCGIIKSLERKTVEMLSTLENNSFLRKNKNIHVLTGYIFLVLITYDSRHTYL